MKKKILISLGLTSVVAASVAFGAFAANKLTLVVNGKVSSAETKVISGTTYVPLRAAAELLGAEVKYDASTGRVEINSASGEYTTTGSTTKQTAKSYSVDVTVNGGPMVLKITKVTLDPTYKGYSFSTEERAVILDVSVENTSNDKVTWHVDQSEIVLNTKEQVEITLPSENRISSEFNGKVVKKGQIVFPVKSELTDITDIRLLLKYVLNGEYETLAEDQETTITLQ
ncbi:stalk domain-containing protein [Paenibacillus methanolicus]|uniref:Copper amine oxidase-like protein n=1 Tax=Paenibacillus methanolicus TaxID=582686 RepID=A0A5S5BKX1_9BACL|nr:stalk domain-containing protein [Paenibacillus methanolicus]TYP67711.1 copper amine oxidase-like protein [Paenibacillus methanolicus]